MRKSRSAKPPATHTVKALLVSQSNELIATLRELAQACPDVAPVGVVGGIEAARAEIRKYKPELVLIDMFLGAESGLELALQIKSTSRAPRVIVLAPHGGLAVQVAVTQSEADAYINVQKVRTELPHLIHVMFPQLRKPEECSA